MSKAKGALHPVADFSTAVLTRFPFPRTDLSHGLGDGYAERGVTVQDGDPDLELGDLTVEIPCP